MKMKKLTQEAADALNTRNRLHFQKQHRLVVEKLAEQVRPSIQESARFQAEEQARVDRGKRRPLGQNEGLTADAR